MARSGRRERPQGEGSVLMLTVSGTHYSFDFESLDSMVDYVEDNGAQGRWKYDPHSRHRAGSFHGRHGWKATIKAARLGWKEGREAFAGKVMAAKVMASIEKRDAFDYDVAGYRPLVPLYAAGCPAHMLTVVDSESMTSNVVRLQVDLCAGAGRSSESLVNWGSALCVLVDALTTAGQSVEVIGSIRVTRTGDDSVESVTANTVIKPAGQSLDIDRMAFALAHPCYLRRLFFALVESVPETYKGYNSGYGACAAPLAKAGTRTISGVNANKDAADCLDTAIERVERIYNGD